MDKAEIQQIAAFLSDCHEAACEWDGTETMRLYLDRLYETIGRIRIAAPDRKDRDARFVLALAAKQARRLRRQIEERSGTRN